MSSDTVQQSPQQYPEELDKAWKALREFVLDIVKEAEIEQKVAERLQKT